MISESRTRRENFILILTLGFLNTLTPFSIDLYLPAFTQIAHDLNTSAARVSLSVAIYFIGFAIGQIVYGPALDRFGRKRPLYLGLLIYLAASIGCMNSHSIEALLVFRFLSALGGSVASVGAMAMVRDFFPAKDAAKIFSFLMLVLSVSPLLAPTFGGFLVTAIGWRSLFAVLSAIAAADLLLVAFALPEGHQPDRSVVLRPGPIARSFWEIFKNPCFRIYAVSGSFSFAGLFVYVAGSPSIFMDGFKIGPKIYGAIFAFLAAGMIGGGQLNHLLVRKRGSAEIFRAALILQVVIGSVFFLGAASDRLGLVATVGFLFTLLLCAGVTSPNSSALALEPFSKNMGSASALLGFSQLGLGSLVSAIVGLINVKGLLSTAAVMFASSLIGLGFLAMGRRSTDI